MNRKLTPKSLPSAIGVKSLMQKYRTERWTRMAVVFAPFWCFMILNLVGGGPQLYALSLALAYIMVAILVFGAPAFLVNWRSATTAAQRGVHLPAVSGQVRRDRIAPEAGRPAYEQDARAGKQR